MNEMVLSQPGEAGSQRNGLVIAAVMLALFVSSFSQTVAGVALPRIIGELGGISLYSWVLIASMLAATAVTPLVGKLSDLYGRKVFLMGGIALFMAASALTGAAQNMVQLISFRAVQGLASGTIMASAFATIGDLFPPAERGRYFGLFTGVFAVASVTGPLLGGFLTDYWGWRWVFYVNLPLGFLALAVLARGLPAGRIAPRSEPIDWLGMATLLWCVVPLLFALAWAGDRFPWGSWQIGGLMLVAALGLLAFLAAERWAADPVLPLFLFQDRTFVVASIISFLTGMGLFGALSYMPLYIQGALGASATNSGLVNMPLMVGLAAASIVAGQLASRTGRYRWTVVAGGAVLAGGMAITLPFDEQTALALPIAAMVVVGVGLGLSMPLLGLAVQNALSERLLGVASSSSQFFREIGGTLGIALSGTLVTAQLRNDLLGRLPPEVTAHVPADTLSRVEDPRILLSPEALGQLRGGFAALGPDGLALYTTTVNAMRGVLADGLHDVFLVGTVIALFVLAVSVFLPELPLRSAEPVLAYRPAWFGTNGRRAAVGIPSLTVSRRAMPTSVPLVWRLNGYWKRRPCRSPVVAVHYRRREDGRP
jgi:EmrB/QacA subfamily drug resistance transporter